VGNPPIIELNGKKYDAETGRLLGSNSGTSKQMNNQKNPIRSVDGIIQSPNYQAVHKKFTDTKQSIEDSTKEFTRKVAPNIQRVSEHSKTLMRKAVKKPTLVQDSNGLKPRLQIGHHYQQNMEHINKAVSTSAAVVKPVIDGALSRAQSIQRSQLVTRFNEMKTAKPELPPEIVQELKSLPPSADDIHAKNLAKLKDQEKEGIDSIDKDFNNVAVEMATSYKPIDKTKKIRAYQKIADKLHMRPKIFIVLVSVVVAILVVGSILYKFKDNIVFYIYDKKVGISSNLPGYVVSGFRISTISRDGNSVSVSYQSNSDSRKYSITEQSSNWDSQSLLAGAVTPNVGTNYTSLEANGRIVYAFSDKAVWVDGGIYYILIDNANLTSNQLTQIIEGS
jgi:hypothetical protein